MRLRRLGVATLAIAAAAGAAPAAIGFGELEACMRPLSHRGNTDIWPANTVEAFDAALDDGFRGVELDVHFSRDGVAIVSHDDWLPVATNCTGDIASRNADYIRRCTALRTPLIPESRFLARRSKRQALVPTLGKAMGDLLADRRVESVVIDLKPVVGPPAMMEALRAAICAGAADCAPAERRVTFISQNRFDAGRLHAAFPNAHIALESNRTVSGLIDEPDGAHWSDRNVDTFSISFNSLFDPKLLAVKLLRFENLTPRKRFHAFYVRNGALPPPRRLLGWTVNSRAGIRGLHRYAFDEVLTDLSYARFEQWWRETAGAVGGKPLCPRGPVRQAR